MISYKSVINSSNICISLCFAFLLAIFAPLDFYLANKTSFDFGADEFLPYSIVIFLLLFGAVFVVFTIVQLINGKVYDLLLSLVIGSMFALYTQGNINPTDYGTLDGSAIEWTNFKMEGIISILTFIVFPVLFTIILKKMGHNKYIKLCRNMCVLMFMYLLLSLVLLTMSQGGIRKESEYVATTQRLHEYSDNENIVVLMLDSYDSTILNQILKNDNTGRYYELLDDFVFYRNTSGMYSFTGLAVPHFISGIEYHNDMTVGDYLIKGYSESRMLNAFSDNNWNVGIYSPVLFPNNKVSLRVDNVSLVNRTVSSHRRLLSLMYRLVAYRYLPQQLKPYFWLYPEDELSSMADNREGVELYSDSNIRFYAELLENHAVDDSNMFKFIHLYGAHEPYTLDEEFNEIDGGTDIVTSDKGVLKMVDAYLTKLREEGVYDNTSIIICADHGTEMRTAPLFMIKYKNADHPLIVNDVAFSYANINELIIDLLENHGNEESAEALMDSLSGGYRHILKYTHNAGLGYSSYCSDITEYEVDGYVWDSNSYKATGVIYEEP